MPDNNNGNNPSNAGSGSNPDILSSLQGYINNTNTSRNNAIALLKSIDQTTKQILQSGGGMSASNAQNMMPGARGSNTYFQSRTNYSSRGLGGGGSFRQFTDNLQKTMMEELIGNEFKNSLRDIRDKLARDLGVNVEQVPAELGKMLGGKLAGAIKNLKPVDEAIGSFKDIISGKFNDIKNAYVRGRNNNYASTHDGAAYNPQRSSASTIRDAIRTPSGTSMFGGSSAPGGSNRAAYNIQAQTVIIRANSIIQESERPEGLQGNLSDDALSSILDLLGGGSSVDDMVNGISSILKGSASSAGAAGAEAVGAGAAGAEAVGAGAGAAGASAAGAASAGAGAVGAGITEALGALSAVAPEILLIIGAVVAATMVFDALVDAGKPMIEGSKKLFKSLSDAANRYEKSREEGLKAAEARMKADFETVIREPFKILEDAAQNLYDAWDQNVRIINGTQGYNKDQLYDLIGGFADRLRAEGLERVVSTDTVTTNLAKVLESGLSGSVAEEFAYLATKLNAAIPTEDFFNYASTYSSIAANAIQQGKSQSEAISYANSQLESFASNLLYASREISGGFTTGLKDANTLFQQSVQIAQASRTNNATQISGVMTAVSAIVGAVAPDLATSMTDAIYKAATGGNSSEIVALRSLAGINASNTEFLKKLSEDPQGVFTNLFDNLGNMQKMSQDSYMEVAEGLSSVFGVSMDAFARVDFNYLAQAISSMNTSNGSLEENLELLASGETTTNAEQLRMQQINEYMWNEGLAYVMDNAAAREIQKHMWDEQIARELMESEYSVNIKGAALEFLEGIRKTIDNILGFLNPFKMFSKLSNLVGSIEEAEAQDVDVKQLLELGKLGGGNATALYQLTTRNTDLNLTESLVNMMGGVSAYNIASTKRKVTSDLLYTGWNSLFDATYGGHGMNALYALASTEAGKAGQNVSSMFNGKSAYSWGTIGKSTASALSSTASLSATSTSGGLAAISSEQQEASATAQAQKVATQNLTNMLNSMQTYVDEATAKGETADYDEWVKSASSTNRIDDFAAALQEAGMTEEAVKSQFDSATTQAAQTAEKERKLREEKFWTDTVDLLTVNNTMLQSIFDKQTEFFQAIVDYFIDHLVYSSSYSHTDVSTVQKKEKNKSETAIYELARALTQNTTDLLDPTVQTNAILAQILKLVNVLVQQGTLNTESGAMSNILANMATGNWELKVPTSSSSE